MEIKQLTAKEYGALFPTPQHVYNSLPFAELNAAKVVEVKHLVFTDGKPRVGLTVGLTADGELRAPWSAPFGGFDFNRSQSAAVMLAVAQTLRRDLPGLRLVLPPPVYGGDMNVKTALALQTTGDRPDFVEWNYHISLQGLDCMEAYEARLSSAARNKLRGAGRLGLEFRCVNHQPMEAYEIIRANREAHGYALRMTAADVLATTGAAGPVKADFFCLGDVAAAMVYHAAPGIAQVIYWGDRPHSGAPNAMNLLAARLFVHYASQGFHTVDVGPSSEEGIPSAGLCDFKESVGCQVRPKPVFLINEP